MGCGVRPAIAKGEVKCSPDILRVSATGSSTAVPTRPRDHSAASLRESRVGRRCLERAVNGPSFPLNSPRLRLPAEWASPNHAIRDRVGVPGSSVCQRASLRLFAERSRIGTSGIDRAGPKSPPAFRAHHR